MDRAIPQSVRRKRRLIRYAIYIGTACILAFAIVILSKQLTPSIESRNILVGEVDSGRIDISITASGTVVPAYELTITSPIASQILEVYAHSGDSVDVGTPLLRLDLEAAQATYAKEVDEQEIRRQQTIQLETNIATQRADREMQIEIEEMRIAQLEAELRNEQYLDSLGSGTRDRLRQAETALRTARMQLDGLRGQVAGEARVREADLRMKRLQDNIADKNLAQTRRTLDEANIRSPRRATLTYILSEVGSTVGPGTKLAVVSDLSQFKIDCKVSDAYSDRVKAGGRITAKVGREMMDGTISSVTPLSQNGVITFTAVMDNPSHPRLRSGLNVEIYVITSIRDDVLRLPNGSFYNGPGEYTLFVFTSEGIVEPRTVRLGQCNYNHIEVLDGLRAGDRVVVSDMSKWKGRNRIKVTD